MENLALDDKREPLYSWCIAFACFWLSFLTVGLHRSAGVIYVSVVHVFDISREQAIWPFSLCGSLMCLLGPLAGFLTHYFSIRSILVCGILVSAIAIAVCFFSSSLLFLIIFFGLFRGIGNGLVVTLNPVLIHQHFKHRKATATGIAYAGASVGSFALPPLIEHLLGTYGFNGCFLLLGAIILNGLVPAFMARDPPSENKKINLAIMEHVAGNGVSPVKGGDVTLEPSPAEGLSDPLVVKKSNDTNGDMTRHQIILITDKTSPDYQPLPTAPLDHTTTTTSPPPQIKLPVLGSTGPISLFQKMQQRDVFQQFRHTAEILTHPVHLAVCLTFGCNVVNFIAYLTVVVDFARDRGVGEQDAVFLVSAFSVGDLFGAVCLGWLSDLGCMPRKYTVTLCFGAMGALLLGLPHCQTHALFLAVSVCMGVFNGCVMTNVPVVMREWLGLERLAVAVGLGHFFVGVGQLLFPMLIGYFRDNVGSYDHLFTTLGVMCIICSILWLIEPLLRKLTKE